MIQVSSHSSVNIYFHNDLFYCFLDNKVNNNPSYTHRNIVNVRKFIIKNLNSATLNKKFEPFDAMLLRLPLLPVKRKVINIVGKFALLEDNTTVFKTELIPMSETENIQYLELIGMLNKMINLQSQIDSLYKEKSELFKGAVNLKNIIPKLDENK